MVPQPPTDSPPSGRPPEAAPADAPEAASDAGRLGDPRYRGLYLADLRITWPGPDADSIYKGEEADLATVYPEELSGAVSELEDSARALAALGPPARLSPDRLPERSALLSERRRVLRLVGLHERRVRGGHLALATRLGRGWAPRLRSLGASLFAVETLAGRLSDAHEALSRPAGGSGRRALAAALDAEALSVRETLARFSPESDYFGDAPLPPVPPAPSKPERRPKTRRSIARAEALSAALAVRRNRALEALLAAEDLLFGWRSASMTEAPVEAPPPLDPPAPPQAAAPYGRPDPYGLSDPADRAGAGGPGRAARSRLRLVAAATVGLAAAVLVFGLIKPSGAPPGPRTLHVLNSLGTPVTVDVLGERVELPPGGRRTLEMPGGGPAGAADAPVAAWTPENLIERFDRLPAPDRSDLGAARWDRDGDGDPDGGDGWALVYNVAGGCPLVEWEAVYARRASDGPTRERRLGAPVFAFTFADVVLDDPPKSIRVQGGVRTRLILSAPTGVNPRRALEAASGEAAASVVRAQARWGRPESLWTPVWLALLADGAGDYGGGGSGDGVAGVAGSGAGGSGNGAAAAVLAGRLEDFPLDPLTNELFLRLASPEAAEAWCQSLFALMAVARDPSAGDEGGDLGPGGSGPAGPAAASSDHAGSGAASPGRTGSGSASYGAALPGPAGSGPAVRRASAAPRPDAGADHAFLSALCLPEERRRAAIGELLELYPDHAWLNRSEGWALFRQDRLAEALARLEAALAAEPAALMADLPTLARLRQHQGVDLFTIADDLGPLEPSLSRLARRSPIPLTARPPAGSFPGEGQAAEDLAYAYLEKGWLEEALAAVGPGPLADRIAILAAGAANPAHVLVERALALPIGRARAAGVPWVSLGLRLRAGLPTGPFEEDLLAESALAGSRGPAVLALAALKEGRPSDLPALYLGRDPWFQGQVCLAAWLAAGDAAPPDCRDRAAGFLFPGERPPMARAARPSGVPPARTLPPGGSTGVHYPWTDDHPDDSREGPPADASADAATDATDAPPPDAEDGPPADEPADATTDANDVPPPDAEDDPPADEPTETTSSTTDAPPPYAEGGPPADEPADAADVAPPADPDAPPAGASSGASPAVSDGLIP